MKMKQIIVFMMILAISNCTSSTTSSPTCFCKEEEGDWVCGARGTEDPCDAGDVKTRICPACANAGDALKCEMKTVDCWPNINWTMIGTPNGNANPNAWKHDRNDNCTKPADSTCQAICAAKPDQMDYWCCRGIQFNNACYKSCNTCFAGYDCAKGSCPTPSPTDQAKVNDKRSDNATKYTKEGKTVTYTLSVFGGLVIFIICYIVFRIKKKRDKKRINSKIHIDNIAENYNDKANDKANDNHDNATTV